MKDHLVGQMHNDLRDTANRFIGAEQLRERLVRVVAPLVAENKYLTGLLGLALCKDCGGSGSYFDCHGNVCQCQWCYEVKEILK